MSFTYNLDGAVVAAAGTGFSSIRRHDYTRLPTEIVGDGATVELRYDSFGRRLHKAAESQLFYRRGVHHPMADRILGPENDDGGRESHHTLVEYKNGETHIYLFTPTGQTVSRRSSGYARVSRDHLRSVRAEAMESTVISACYSAYGETLVTGGKLRRAFAGYEPDIETKLYNAHRRLYSPDVRIFISVDPRLRDSSPYPYCAGDPFNRIDPTGAINSAIISGIIAGLALIVSIAVTIFTAAVAAPATLPSIVGTAFSTMAALTSSAPVSSTVTFTAFGAALGAVSAIVSNGAQLIVKAANGEHISAWQSVRSMLIEPVIAAVAGAVGGAVGGKTFSTVAGLGKLTWPIRVIASAVTGGVTGSLVEGTASATVERDIGAREGWRRIGIQMAVAVGEALILMAAFRGGIHILAERQVIKFPGDINALLGVDTPSPAQPSASSGTVSSRTSSPGLSADYTSGNAAANISGIVPGAPPDLVVYGSNYPPPYVTSAQILPAYGYGTEGGYVFGYQQPVNMESSSSYM